MDEFFERTSAMKRYLVDDQEYIVEYIKAFKLIDGEAHYLIKWKGFNDTYNSWEPEDHLEFHPAEYDWECAIPESIRRNLRKRPVEETNLHNQEGLRRSLRNRPVEEEVWEEDEEFNELLKRQFGY